MFHDVLFKKINTHFECQQLVKKMDESKRRQEMWNILQLIRFMRNTIRQKKKSALENKTGCIKTFFFKGRPVQQNKNLKNTTKEDLNREVAEIIY